MPKKGSSSAPTLPKNWKEKEKPDGSRGRTWKSIWGPTNPSDNQLMREVNQYIGSLLAQGWMIRGVVKNPAPGGEWYAITFHRD